MSFELSLDTSTNHSGIALSEQGVPFAEYSWVSRFNHTVELLPAIDMLITHHRRNRQDIGAVFVALGPGGFSSLRVGLSTAKGLALALDIPIVGIGTMLVEATPYAWQSLPIRPVMDGGRGEFATALFKADAGQLKQLETERVVPFEELAQSFTESTLVCGEHAPAVIERLREKVGDKAVFPGAGVRSPGHLATLAWRKLSSGYRDDINTLEPIYMRAPSITAKKTKTSA